MKFHHIPPQTNNLTLSDVIAGESNLKHFYCIISYFHTAAARRFVRRSFQFPIAINIHESNWIELGKEGNQYAEGKWWIARTPKLISMFNSCKCSFSSISVDGSARAFGNDDDELSKEHFLLSSNSISLALQKENVKYWWQHRKHRNEVRSYVVCTKSYFRFTLLACAAEHISIIVVSSIH